VDVVKTKIGAVVVPLFLLGIALLAQQAGRGPKANVQSPHGTLNMPCENCHTFTAWRPIRSLPDFDHNRTRYPLRGMHASVACTQCHTSLVFTNVGKRCADCHADIHRRQMGANCESCHTVKGWKVSVQAINAHQNRFPLVGAHAAVDCEQCHTNAAAGQYIGLSTNCVSCHMKDFQTPVLDHRAMGFPTDCTVCHSMNSWMGAKFDHAKFANFPLTGIHATLDCQACHANNNFKGVSADCFSCHAKDFNGATEPNHVQAAFPHDCAQCHSTSSWAGAQFDHATTGFPLTGAHASTPCASCHVNNNYQLRSAACFTCHVNDFNGTTNPNHKVANLPTDCSICHTTTDWNGAKFDHTKYTKFPLTGLHVTVACAQCHVNNNYAGTPTDCASCHINDFNGTTNPNHKASGFPTTCETCHTTAGWMQATFDHSKTGFPLTGTHNTLQCAQCHVNGNYNITVSTCVSCHLNDYNGTNNPNHKTVNFPTTCETCHSTVDWTGASFDHSTTSFPLTGLHKTVQCTQCHVNNNYTTLPTACAGCHINDYNGTTNPNHKTSGFPTTCETCHNTTGWDNSTFNHANTGFALTGAHTTVQCAQCHVNNNYNLTSGACVTCHQADYNGTTNPNHKTAGFPTTCDTCHNTTDWNNAKFDHNTTSFPLTGLHTTVQCTLCHVNNNYTGNLPTSCSSCHINDYNGTTNPNHKASGFPTTCETCHTTAGWQPSTFNHATTGFPLTGAHATVQCAQCHVNGNYNITVSTCISCHQTDYNNTSSPPHKVANLPTDCTLCHTMVDWSGATFDHNKYTTFPLTGAHVSVACVQCHVNNNYTTTATDCASCHITDYNGTTNPPHKSGGFPTTCETCHTTSAWQPATFDHSKTTFPLTGLHTTVQCAQCHTNNNYSGNLPTACSGCHITDYNNTTNPAHKAAGFPTDCTICHTTAGWQQSSFNHSTTGFALTGAHTSLQCAQCHVNGNYSLTSTNALCYSCHQTDWTGTTNPNHASAGFPTTCETCHTTTDWTGAVFDHSKTAFPLTGAHTTVACTKCHVNNVFAGTPTDCYSCHKADYTGTTNPNHAASSFPTTCATCHTTTSWAGATFNHTWFPIYSGTHAGKWTTCADCHVNSSDYSVFSCITCHQHSQANTDGNHRGVKNYVYSATSCYSCHPTGNGG
jgi:hypothetical protein